MGAISACIFGTLALAVSFAHAENSASLKLMGEMEGVYKFRFTNRASTGSEKWEAEDIVEIVPFDDAHVYFRLSKEGGNGHMCMLYGIAAYEDGSFVFRDRKYDEIFKERCTLRISLSETTLNLTDGVPHAPYGASTCRQYCGARVSLYDFSLKRGSKRKIRYLNVIKASTQYQQAVQDFKVDSTEKQK